MPAPNQIVVANIGKRPVELHYGSVTHQLAPGAELTLPRERGAVLAHLDELVQVGVLTVVTKQPAKKAAPVKKAPRAQKRAAKRTAAKKSARKRTGGS